MFIKNSRGGLIAPLTDVNASQLYGCTILANISATQARRLKFVALAESHTLKSAFVTTDIAMYYEFINNSK